MLCGGNDDVSNDNECIWSYGHVAFDRGNATVHKYGRFKFGIGLGTYGVHKSVGRAYLFKNISGEVKR